MRTKRLIYRKNLVLRCLERSFATSKTFGLAMLAPRLCLPSTNLISLTYIPSYIASFAIRLDIASYADRIVGPRDRCGLIAVRTSVSSLNARSASVLRSCRRYNANSKGSPSLLASSDRSRWVSRLFPILVRVSIIQGLNLGLCFIERTRGAHS
jgi:hypothetical protein